MPQQVVGPSHGGTCASDERVLARLHGTRRRTGCVANDSSSTRARPEVAGRHVLQVGDASCVLINARIRVVASMRKARVARRA